MFENQYIALLKADILPTQTTACLTVYRNDAIILIISLYLKQTNRC